MVELGVNIDHIATLRQARLTYEPDPAWAAVEAQLGGADVITLHLREDRRHIQDRDLQTVQHACQVGLNLEMAATDEMVEIACALGPHMATLVPEGRQEVTTEGGLDVAGQLSRLKNVTALLREAGICPSAFIDADPDQVRAAADAGFEACEVHTGPYAHAFHAAAGNFRRPDLRQALDRVAQTGSMITALGLRFNAGHALNYANVKPIAALPALEQLHIGHAIVSRALFIGLRAAVTEMKQLINTAAHPYTTSQGP